MRFSVFFAVLLIIIGCKSNQKSTSTQKTKDKNEVIISQTSLKQSNYKATPLLSWDLIHTELNVSFNFENEQVIGEAKLQVSPHFYPKRQLFLDAKAFDIEQISIVDDTSTALTYKYNGKKVHITFSKLYSKNDTLKLYIKYIANPNKVDQISGPAIRGGKGLYFINAQQNNPNKPVQIWTQGETDYSSCWFPTLDEPNQKMTQEIAITVPDSFKTLSNGSLEFATENGDGTRTDYWLQAKAHSPYLAMLAIGKFSVYNDQWRGIDVDYYTESQYAKDAPFIFGSTPAMLEYYSNLLGVEFPWDKYAQVVVRDFVSGAMENTSATLHGEFVQRHKKELIDYSQEGIIAHELFHQWFGDLVSCESWSNLSLNEAFATYGEYLWYEKSKTPFEAQYNLEQKQKSYLNESRYKKVDLVRFNYHKKLEMFDAHTYSKGACILHQLRTIIGDEAFFEGLKLYLNRYAHKSAEMHQLRLIMEEVTGQDLNWFFNQWAFDNGHPKLTITYHFDALSQSNFMVVRQSQDLDEQPLYQIPLIVKGYQSYAEMLDTVFIKDEIDTIYLKGNSPNTWVDYDTQDYLLGQIDEPNKTADAWYAQFIANTSYRDVFSSLYTLTSNHPKELATKKAITQALGHSFFGIRQEALKSMVNSNQFEESYKKARLLQFITNDVNSKNRALAFKLYRTNFTPEALNDFYELAAEDSSYFVIQTAIKTGILLEDTAQVLALCKMNQNAENEELILTIAGGYSVFGDITNLDFYDKNLTTIGIYKKSNFLNLYAQYLIMLDHTDELLAGYLMVKNVLDTSNVQWVREAAANELVKLYKSASSRNASTTEMPEKENYKIRLDAINSVITTVLETEQDSTIIERLENR